MLEYQIKSEFCRLVFRKLPWVYLNSLCFFLEYFFFCSQIFCFPYDIFNHTPIIHIFVRLPVEPVLESGYFFFSLKQLEVWLGLLRVNTFLSPFLFFKCCFLNVDFFVPSFVFAWCVWVYVLFYVLFISVALGELSFVRCARHVKKCWRRHSRETASGYCGLRRTDRGLVSHRRY